MHESDAERGPRDPQRSKLGEAAADTPGIGLAVPVVSANTHGGTLNVIGRVAAPSGDMAGGAPALAVVLLRRRDKWGVTAGGVTAGSTTAGGVAADDVRRMAVLLVA